MSIWFRAKTEVLFSEPACAKTGIHKSTLAPCTTCWITLADILVPGISDCSLNEVIARACPATADDRPLIGRIDPGLVISTGYSRHGVLLSPLGSTLTADLTEHLPASAMLKDVDPYRFPTYSLITFWSKVHDFNQHHG